MSEAQPWRLYEVFGVEVEYMIVDRDTLAVRPVADELLKGMAGDYVQDVERGRFAWSNELVCHVIELKTNGPAPDMRGLDRGFHGEIQFINARLAHDNAMLLGGGAHPLFDPATETRLWPHGDQEIYAAYDRIFDCRGHGWSNLQSVHLNLPFAGDEEFGRLHAAVRLVLPIIPALSASTPVLDGRVTGLMDTRLETYRHNQAIIPCIAGGVIPEAVFTRADYTREILDRIDAAITPLDTEGVLDPVFVNSRGAIARFDRNAIEIRVIDTQEAPAADIAILDAVVAVLRALTGERFASLRRQQQWPHDLLAEIFFAVVRDGDAAVIRNSDYLAMFDYPGGSATAGELWRHLARTLASSLDSGCRPALRHLLEKGPLARRLTRALGSRPTLKRLQATYAGLAQCLERNRLFA